MKLEMRYSALTLAAIAVIFALSSMPDFSADQGPLLRLAWNLAHIPAFGVLALVMLKAISGTERVSWERCGVVLLASAVYAVVDEWHQSFVPGRHASIDDVLLDLAGITGMLLLVRFTGVSTRERVTES